MTDPIQKLTDAVEELAAQYGVKKRRTEVPLFGRRPVEIRKADQPTPAGRAADAALQRAGWQTALSLAQAREEAAGGTLTRDQALSQVFAERPDLLEQCRGTYDYLDAGEVLVDAGAMTGADVAQREIDALTEQVKRADPSLTDAAAMVKALDTPEGKAAYARHRDPQAKLTALELATVAKRGCENLQRLMKWGAPTCGAFVDDRVREIDAAAFSDPERLTAAYSVVAEVFPAEFAGARQGL